MELAATTKRGQTTRSGAGGGMAGDLDRLSALPDCLLHDIMSFMKARQVVQTCVLSSRWRHIWRPVPCFDVDLDEFETVTYRRRDWEHFAINLMLHHNIELLDSFRLNVSNKAPQFGPEHAGTWVRRAMKYCDSSWRLKRLHLCNVFLDDRFARHVDSSCRSLEDLELEDCRCSKLDAITSHSLKNLLLKDCTFFAFSGITSPTLKSLVIDGGSIMNLSIDGESKNNPLVIAALCVPYLRLAVGAHNLYWHFNNRDDITYQGFTASRSTGRRW